MAFSILNIKKLKIWSLHETMLFALLSFFINQTSGQTNYKPGYIITKENDTINGLIDYRGDFRNSKKCSFKANENSKSIEYNPFEIKGFHFNNGKFYVSKSISIENSPDSIFVEYLVNGIADLFYYRDIDHDHYLIENNGELFELSNEEIYGYDKDKKIRYVRNSNKYIGLLKVTFSDCVELFPQIDKAELSHKSLINLTKNYHDYVCNDQQCIIYEKPLPVVRIRLAPVINFNISNLGFKKDPFYSSFDFEKSLSMSIGGIMNMSMPRQNENFSTQLELSGGKNYFYSLYIQDKGLFGKDYYDFHIFTSYLKGSLALTYTYPKGKIRPVIGLGGSICYWADYKVKIILEQANLSYINTYEFSDIQTPDILYGGFGRIGLNYYLSKRTIAFLNLTYDYNYGYDLELSSVIKTLGFNLGFFM
jgi:hypothetical protein